MFLFIINYYFLFIFFLLFFYYYHGGLDATCNSTPLHIQRSFLHDRTGSLNLLTSILEDLHKYILYSFIFCSSICIDISRRDHKYRAKEKNARRSNG